MKRAFEDRWQWRSIEGALRWFLKRAGSPALKSIDIQPRGIDGKTTDEDRERDRRTLAALTYCWRNVCESDIPERHLTRRHREVLYQSFHADRDLNYIAEELEIGIKMLRRFIDNGFSILGRRYRARGLVAVKSDNDDEAAA